MTVSSGVCEMLGLASSGDVALIGIMFQTISKFYFQGLVLL